MKSFYKAGGVLCFLPATPLQLFSIFTRRAFSRFLPCCIFLLLFGLPDARSQSPEKQEAVSGGEIQPLQIGDTIPEVLWNMPLQVVNHPEGKETITLGDYRDKELIILDFWATWCAPCITSLNKLDTLQKEFYEELTVIPIGLEQAEKISPFFKRNGWNMMSTTKANANRFQAYFPFKAIPYQVWIKTDKVLATTFSSQSTHENIKKVIETESAEGLSIRKDNLTYDSKRPLIFNNNGGELSDVMYSSVITGYLEGILGGGIQTDSLNRRRLRIINADIGRLYRTAASRYNHSLFFRGRMIVGESIKQLIPDGNPQDQLDLRPYFYSYELIASVENDTILSHYAIEDLNRLFRDRGINGYIEIREIPCYVFSLEKEQFQGEKNERNSLSTTEFSDSNILFKNTPSEEAFSQIQSLFSSLETPLINEMPNSSLTFEIPNSRQNRNFQEVREAMARQGIQIKKELRELEVIVIEKST